MKAFFDSVRIRKKEVSLLNIKKNAEIVDELSIGLSVDLNDNNSPSIFSENDHQKITIVFQACVVDRKKWDSLKKESPELSPFDMDSLFEVSIELELFLFFVKGLKCETSLVEDFPIQILSFAYDDIKLIVEEQINRTSYKGFALPYDFRDILKLNP